MIFTLIVLALLFVVPGIRNKTIKRVVITALVALFFLLAYAQQVAKEKHVAKWRREQDQAERNFLRSLTK